VSLRAARGRRGRARTTSSSPTSPAPSRVPRPRPRPRPRRGCGGPEAGRLRCVVLRRAGCGAQASPRSSSTPRRSPTFAARTRKWTWAPTCSSRCVALQTRPAQPAARTGGGPAAGARLTQGGWPQVLSRMAGLARRAPAGSYTAQVPRPLPGAVLARCAATCTAGTRRCLWAHLPPCGQGGRCAQKGRAAVIGRSFKSSYNLSLSRRPSRASCSPSARRPTALPRCEPPPLLPRTNRTSLVPPLVLSGHTASLTPY
jgi:hypothetical protein